MAANNTNMWLNDGRQHYICLYFSKNQTPPGPVVCSICPQLHSSLRFNLECSESAYFRYSHVIMCLYKTSLGILTYHRNALDHIKKGLGLEDHQHGLQSVFRRLIQEVSTQPQQGHSMSFLHCSASELPASMCSGPQESTS